MYYQNLTKRNNHHALAHHNLHNINGWFFEIQGEMDGGHWRHIVWPDFYKPAESDHNCKHQCIIDFQFRSVLITSAMKMLKTNELEKCHFNTEKALILLTLQLKSWKCKIMISLLRYAFALWSCCSHNTSHIACLSLRRKWKLLKIWINRSGSCGESRCAAAW